MDNVDVLEKANFSKVSSEKRLEIIRIFLKNPHFDEVDLYYEGLLDEEEEESLLSEEKKIPKGSLEETEPSKKKSPNPNLDEKGKRSKREKKRPRTVDQQQEAEEDRAKKIRSSAPPPPPPKVPPKLKTRIEKLGGSQVMLVIEKELSLTDVTPRNGRFSLPLTKINLDFLTPGEREVLSGKTTSGLPKPEIQSQLIQPCGEECTINLREWHMKKSPIYNLVTTWNNVVKTNSLDKGITVQLWSFRVDSQLRLALVKAGKDIQ